MIKRAFSAKQKCKKLFLASAPLRGVCVCVKSEVTLFAYKLQSYLEKDLLVNEKLNEKVSVV